MKRIKNLCLRILPEMLLLIIKKFYYARALKMVCEKDEVDLKVIKHLVENGDHVIDIGANIGVYTKFLSEWVGVHGQVFSIEPIPQTFKILCSNVKKLRLRNVILMNYAISENNAVVTMEIPFYKTGGRNFYQAKIIDKDTDADNSNYIKIYSKTIDSLFSELSHNNISFIKCDVEGHEISCIRGATNVIKNSRPAWLIEISGDPDEINSTAYQSFQKLIREGYAPYWFDGTNLKLRHFGDKSVNYFFLTPNHLGVLKSKSDLLTTR